MELLTEENEQTLNEKEKATARGVKRSLFRRDFQVKQIINLTEIMVLKNGKFLGMGEIERMQQRR